jgi:pyridinium-3,5-bisthiocarboxylic acid mononucleotide nickel chelatase
MSIIYFNCRSGISGDMVVGSLLDLGIETEYLARELSKMDLSGYSINSRKVNKKGVEATKFNVELEPDQPQRNLADINLIIEESSLTRKIKDLSQRVFLNLARSEAFAHHTSIEKVHFHEVGCVDSIIDIVSTAILISRLNIAEVYCGTVSLGRGRTRTEHGILEIPTPAVRYLLKDAPTSLTEFSAELTTPTGAAILNTCVKKYTEALPEKGKTGYGAGSLNLELPNVLQTLIKLMDTE